MRWFFSKIWAGITAFLAWLISPIITLCRGRGGTGNMPTEPRGKSASQTQPVNCWLQTARKLFPAVFGSRLELIFTHSEYLDGRCFRDLKVTIYPAGQPEGAEYEVDLGSRGKVYVEQTYRIPLKPAASQHAGGTAELRNTRAGAMSNGSILLLWTTKLERIELRLGETSAMFVRQPNGFFAPRAERAA